MARPMVVVTATGVVCPDARTAGELPAAPSGSRAREGWFDARAEIGRGHKYLPPAGQYLLAATGRALASEPAWAADVPVEHKGVAVGTNGGVSSLHDRIDRTVIAADADDLSPATAPYFSVNLLSSALSTQHGLKAFNMTLTTPRTAGLEAIEVGLRALALGRCASFVAGATEDTVTSVEADGGGDPGAAVLLFERRDAVVARGGTILGSCQVRTGFLPPRVAAGPEGAAAAAHVIENAIDRLDDAGEAQIARVDADRSAVGAAVMDALDGAPLADGVTARAASGCLHPVLQLACLLATGDRPVLTVTAAAAGHLGVARLCPERTAVAGSPPAMAVLGRARGPRC